MNRTELDAALPRIALPPNVTATIRNAIMFDGDTEKFAEDRDELPAITLRARWPHPIPDTGTILSPARLAAVADATDLAALLGIACTELWRHALRTMMKLDGRPV